MKKQPYFVIFGAMRTGSNLLERSLSALGDTVCYGEPFNPGFIGNPKTHFLFGCDMADRDKDPEAFLTVLRGEAGGQIPGFRYFDGHAPDLAPRLLQDPLCRRIVLRRDPLASYLSLLTARETGQWILRNAHRRKEARVRFDAVEFEVYREKLALHYAWLESEMKAAGTDAMRISYEDLQDPRVLVRVAQHIGSSGQVPETQPLVRQNPSPLTDRVLNYPEMCAWLGMNPEPRAPLPLPVAEDILLCRKAPLALAPVDGPGGDAALSLLYRLEARSYGGESLAQGKLADPEARQAVFLSGLQGEVLQSGLGARKLLSVVCHPASRMHSMFLDELFGRDWHISAIRRHLMRRHGGIPSPKEIVENAKSIEPERHRALFLSFLDLVTASRDGKGPLVPRRAWFTQAALLSSYQDMVRLDAVGMLEALPSFAAKLADSIGADRLPGSHIAAIEQRVSRRDLPFADIIQDEVLERLRTSNGEDFARFGYGDWPMPIRMSA